MCSYYDGHFDIYNSGYLFDFASIHGIWTPVILNFWPVFHSNRYFLCRRLGTRNWYQTIGIFIGRLLVYIIYKLYANFVGQCPPTPTPTQKFKNVFSIFSSQEIGSSLVSLEMIFRALHSELFRFKFHSLGSKIEKIPEFSLTITVKWFFISDKVLTSVSRCGQSIIQQMESIQHHCRYLTGHHQVNI